MLAKTPDKQETTNFKSTTCCWEGEGTANSIQENKNFQIAYGKWKSYGSANHRALHPVYELDTGNPRTYIEILSTIDVVCKKTKMQCHTMITYSGSNFLTVVVRILAKAAPLWTDRKCEI
jgi:hypothetical protein